MTEEHKHIISITQKGKKLSEEHKKAFVEAGHTPESFARGKETRALKQEIINYYKFNRY
jgi:hypothetical protein